MPVAYPTDAIPHADRCTRCDGSGDDWQEVAPSLWEPVDACPSCYGSGLRPGAKAPTLSRGVHEPAPMADERVGLARVYVLHNGGRASLLSVAPLADDDA